MKYLSSLFVAFVITSFSVAAQQSPIDWSFHTEKTNTDEYTITYSADVKPGWYIYSQHTDPDGPIPTAFYLYNNDSNVVKSLGTPTEEGKRKEGMDPLFGVNVIKFSGLVLFRQQVKATEGTIASGYLEFMACNDEQCLPPEEVKFKVLLK